MCRVLQVSTSGYYQWCRNIITGNNDRNEQLVEQIKKVHKLSNQTYGSPRIYAELKAKGYTCSLNRVARLMQANKIKAEGKKKYIITTDSKHDLPIADNILNQQFTAGAPDEKWSTDITYIWTKEGWLYLAVVLDLFSRRIVGWSMQPTLAKDLVIAALQMALSMRQPACGLLHHSDRGSQYASNEYQKVLKKDGLQPSMSRRGNCYDNAAMESFFATLKKELVYHQSYHTHREAKRDIFYYIEVWYNKKRRHSSLSYLSPEEYEQNWQQLSLVA
jgi:transposase InsO family protein